MSHTTEVFNLHPIEGAANFQNHWTKQLYTPGGVYTVHARGNLKDNDAQTILVQHGLPGSCEEPHFRGSVLYRSGMRIISYARPGYSMSQRRPGRDIASSAQDMLNVINGLNRVAGQTGLTIDSFGLITRSAGGLHGLAAAASHELASRIIGACIFVPGAPPELFDNKQDWLSGMSDGNKKLFGAAYDGDESRVRAAYQATKRDLDRDGFAIVDRLLHDDQAHAHDREILRDDGIRMAFAAGQCAAIAAGVDGPTDDILAASRPKERGGIGFRLSDIKVPLLLWAGEQDIYAPLRHAEVLGREIGDNAEVRRQTNAGHLFHLGRTARGTSILAEARNWIFAQPK